MLDSEYLQALRSIQSENAMNRRMKWGNKMHNLIQCMWTVVFVVSVVFLMIVFGG